MTGAENWVFFIILDLKSQILSARAFGAREYLLHFIDRTRAENQLVRQSMRFTDLEKSRRYEPKKLGVFHDYRSKSFRFSPLATSALANIYCLSYAGDACEITAFAKLRVRRIFRK